MKKNFLVILFVLLGLSLLYGRVSCSEKIVTSGISAPDFQLPDIEQNKFSLKDYKGKKNLLLFFWTTWCPFCQPALKDLNQRYTELGKKGLEVLAINVGEAPQKVAKKIQSDALTFTVLLDTNTEVTRSFEVLGVPSYILVDKDGFILFRGNRFPEKQIAELTAK